MSSDIEPKIKPKTTISTRPSRRYAYKDLEVVSISVDDEFFEKIGNSKEIEKIVHNIHENKEEKIKKILGSDFPDVKIDDFTDYMKDIILLNIEKSYYLYKFF